MQGAEGPERSAGKKQETGRSSSRGRCELVEVRRPKIINNGSNINIRTAGNYFNYTAAPCSRLPLDPAQ